MLPVSSELDLKSISKAFEQLETLRGELRREYTSDNENGKVPALFSSDKLSLQALDHFVFPEGQRTLDAKTLSILKCSTYPFLLSEGAPPSYNVSLASLDLAAEISAMQAQFQEVKEIVAEHRQYALGSQTLNKDEPNDVLLCHDRDPTVVSIPLDKKQEKSLDGVVDSSLLELLVSSSVFTQLCWEVSALKWYYVWVLQHSYNALDAAKKQIEYILSDHRWLSQKRSMESAEDTLILTFTQALSIAEEDRQKVIDIERQRIRSKSKTYKARVPVVLFDTEATDYLTLEEKYLYQELYNQSQHLFLRFTHQLLFQRSPTPRPSRSASLTTISCRSEAETNLNEAIGEENESPIGDLELRKISNETIVAFNEETKFLHRLIASISARREKGLQTSISPKRAELSHTAQMVLYGSVRKETALLEEKKNIALQFLREYHSFLKENALGKHEEIISKLASFIGIPALGFKHGSFFEPLAIEAEIKGDPYLCTDTSLDKLLSQYSSNKRVDEIIIHNYSIPRSDSRSTGISPLENNGNRPKNILTQDNSAPSPSEQPQALNYNTSSFSGHHDDLVEGSNPNAEANDNDDDKSNNGNHKSNDIDGDEPIKDDKEHEYNVYDPHSDENYVVTQRSPGALTPLEGIPSREGSINPVSPILEGVMKLHASESPRPSLVDTTFPNNIDAILDKSSSDDEAEKSQQNYDMRSSLERETGCITPDDANSAGSRRGSNAKSLCNEEVSADLLGDLHGRPIATAFLKLLKTLKIRLACNHSSKRRIGNASMAQLTLHRYWLIACLRLACVKFLLREWDPYTCITHSSAIEKALFDTLQNDKECAQIASCVRALLILITGFSNLVSLGLSSARESTPPSNYKESINFSIQAAIRKPSEIRIKPTVDFILSPMENELWGTLLDAVWFQLDPHLRPNGGLLLTSNGPVDPNVGCGFVYLHSVYLPSELRGDLNELPEVNLTLYYGTRMHGFHDARLLASVASSVSSVALNRNSYDIPEIPHGRSISKNTPLVPSGISSSVSRVTRYNCLRLVMAALLKIEEKDLLPLYACRVTEAQVIPLDQTVFLYSRIISEDAYPSTHPLYSENLLSLGDDDDDDSDDPCRHGVVVGLLPPPAIQLMRLHENAVDEESNKILLSASIHFSAIALMISEMIVQTAALPPILEDIYTVGGTLLEIAVREIKTGKLVPKPIRRTYFEKTKQYARKLTHVDKNRFRSTSISSTHDAVVGKVMIRTLIRDINQFFDEEVKKGKLSVIKGIPHKRNTDKSADVLKAPKELHVDETVEGKSPPEVHRYTEKLDKEESTPEKLYKEESTPEKSDKEESTPEKSDKEESTPEKSDKEESTPEKSDKEESTPEKSDKEESTPEKSDKEESTPEELNTNKPIDDMINLQNQISDVDFSPNSLMASTQFFPCRSSTSLDVLDCRTYTEEL